MTNKKKSNNERSTTFVRFSTEERSFALLGSNIARSYLEPLTPTERSVAELAGLGMRIKEIRSIRSTSSRTVANQLSSIYAKLQISSREELVQLLNGSRTA